MFRLFVRAAAHRTFRHLSSGRLDAFMRVFGPDSVFCFAGNHSLGGEQHGPAEIRRLVERMRRLFPDVSVVPNRLVVTGWPWHTIVTTQLAVRATLPDGSAYENHGLQLLRLRWGKAIEDRVYEDTDVLRAALQTLAAHGVTEALAAPLGHIDVQHDVGAVGR
jgi:ketosteroid isomerase-like protein